MSHNDIFADYIQRLRINNTNLSANEPKSLGINDLANTNTITLLREINRKIDKLEDKKDSRNKEIDIAILNGKVVIPEHGVIHTNLYIKDGKIHSMTSDNSENASKIINASGKYIIPGIIDPHTHLGLFAPSEVELETETRSALIGGVTTIGCFLGSQESYLKVLPEFYQKVSRHSYVDIIPHLVIFNDYQRKEILNYINDLNVTSFKLYMNGIENLIPDIDDGFMLDVFEEIKRTNKKCMVCVHAENRYLVRRATKALKEGLGDEATIIDWSDTHPDIAEEEAVLRLSYLAEKTKTNVYFVHISSDKAINRLRKLKPNNKYLHIETTSPYLSISREKTNGLLGKMEPPFRDSKDIEELWKALEDGVIDAIGTDNVTMTKSEKKVDQGLWGAFPGYPALATHLPVILHEGVIKREIPIEKVINLMTKKPAEIFGIYPKKGCLMPGSDADIVIVDLNKVKEVSSDDLKSRSDFSLYEGNKIQGWPVMTIKCGQIVVDNGEFIESEHQGAIINR